MAKIIKFLTIALLLFPKLIFAEGGEVNSFTVVSDTLAAATSCLHYKIIGVCFWYKWPFGFSTTLMVDHYMPDSVVSVYNHKGSNPWWYANTFVDPMANKAGQAETKAMYGASMEDSNESTESPRDSNDHFKEVDIIGNPAVMIMNYLGLFIPSAAAPYVPYYQSMLDAVTWRSSTTEQFYPQALIPGVAEVGSFPLNDWGNVYPRTGFINQLVDAKAAAVVAERAADITTKSMQPHVYQHLSTDCGHHCSADEVKENSKNVMWQMIYPKKEKKCIVFGENTVLSPTPWHSDATKKGKGNYAWIMWRHYHGCIQGKGKYVGSIRF
jgi:integrating conjugative element protein (TIGR03756 family)